MHFSKSYQIVAQAWVPDFSFHFVLASTLLFLRLLSLTFLVCSVSLSFFPLLLPHHFLSLLIIHDFLSLPHLL